MKVMREQLEAANEELNEANEQIDDLREKLGLTQDNDTYRPITSNMKQTIRMDDMATMQSQGGTINEQEQFYGSIRDPSASVVCHYSYFMKFICFLSISYKKQKTKREEGSIKDLLIQHVPLMIIQWVQQQVRILSEHGMVEWVEED